jgi:hypothetical protein
MAYNFNTHKLVQIYLLYTVFIPKNLLFNKIISQKIKKALQQKAKGLGIGWLPLLDAFRTFMGKMTAENIILNQLILQY